jgi:hypothetical protein
MINTLKWLAVAANVYAAPAGKPIKETPHAKDVLPGMIAEPSLSFKIPPFTKGTAKHWTPKLSSVFHKNKFVLAPALPQVKGYLSSNYRFKAKNW